MVVIRSRGPFLHLIFFFESVNCIILPHQAKLVYVYPELVFFGSEKNV